jgi:NADH-quinone oxidoreductase subunit F
VLTTLKYFKDEYLAHIRDKKCPAGVCRALIKYKVSKENCTGCGLCIKACPIGAIAPTGKKQPVILDQDKCTKCGSCFEACRFEAMVKE